ncbi:MAG: indolepyruvate oxidoreductase subunit beta [Coriobacteriales bacterium]|jgi:indolepyruvate ferredoxin oxidoreductase beta subunit|nr:indolepyruvate oxidoreductase subunit beta [Coriobacteriales bacterium]
MSQNIVIAGVGGQGTILASRLIAQAAINENKQVRSAETIGMAQRGGSVLGHVRVFDANDAHPPMSPLIGPSQADLLMAFEPAEAARNLHLLKAGGCLISADKAIMPVHAQLAKDISQVYDVNRVLLWLNEHSNPDRPDSFQVYLVDGQTILDSLGSSKVLNVVLLGVALSVAALGVQETSLLAALQALVPARLLDLNLQALAEGKVYGTKHERPTMVADNQAVS